MNVGSLTLGAGASFHAYMIWIIITSKHHEGFAVSKSESQNPALS